MSFFKNARIRTKVLVPIFALSVITLSSVSYLSWSYMHADTRYSDFIAHENKATIQLARANMSVHNAAYIAYKVLSYDKSSPEMPSLVTNFADTIKLGRERFLLAEERLPQERDAIRAFIDDAESIFAELEAAVKLGSRGEKDEARSILSIQDAAVTALRKSMVQWVDQGIESVDARSTDLSNEAAFRVSLSLAILAVVFFGAILMTLAITTLGITRPVDQLRKRMLGLAGGETDTAVFGLDRKDEVGQMATAVAVFRDNAVERVRLELEAEANRSHSETERAELETQKARDAATIQEAVDALAIGLEALSMGDVTHRIEAPFGMQLDALRTNFNGSMTKLQHTLCQVKDRTESINAGTQEMRSGADDLARRTEQQAASVEQTAAALEEITTAVKDSARRAEEAGRLVARTREEAERSGAVVNDAVHAMQLIEKSSGEITSIISVIDEIAFQTNLLALNAGVEAARAGEAGKGFAVVAQEVRELAQRSAAAAKDIKQLIGASGQQVEAGVQKVRETGAALRKIASEVKEIDSNVRAIVEAAREQSIGLSEINTAVNAMDQGTQQNSAMVEQTTAATHSLSSDVSSLTKQLAQFKLEGHETASVVAIPAVSRALLRKVANAFSGSSALAKAPHGDSWEAF